MKHPDYAQKPAGVLIVNAFGGLIIISIVLLSVLLNFFMMPMIITVTLAQGARRMTKKKVLVKQLAAIEDFSSIDSRTLATG